MSDSIREARRYGCPSCGGQLHFDLVFQEFVCLQCNTRYQPGRLPPVPEEEQKEDIPVTGYRCPQCGAEIVSPETEATSFCSYCGSDVVLEQRLTHMQRPSRIIPFAVDRKRCERLYRSHLRQHIFCPGKLKRQAVVDHFRPVYIPFWSFHVTANGPCTINGSNVTKDRDETITTNMALELDVSIDQKEILYDASRAFEDETAARLNPQISRAVDFHPAFLSGFYTQVPDAAPETYRDEAITRAYHRLVQSVIRDYRLKEVSAEMDAKRMNLPNVHVEHELVLIPVWLLAHRQGDRLLYAAINGESGKVVCDVPVSPIRVTALTLLFAAALFALLYFLPTMKPDWLVLPCTAFALFAQYRILKVGRILAAREDRETDPFLASPGTYSGPAGRYMQADLNKHLPEESRADKNGLRAVWNRLTTIHLPRDESALVRLIKLPFLFPYIAVKIGIALTPIMAFIWLAMLISTAAFRELSIAGMAAAVIIAMWFCFDVGRRIPDGRYRRFAGIINAFMLMFSIMSLVLLLLNPAEDLVFYTCCMLPMMINVAGMIFLWSQHNRYTTRPVPFFKGVIR